MVPKIENILFISDLSEDSMPALAWSMMLAHRHDAGITFLYVIENELPRAKIGVRSVSGEELNTALSDSSRPVFVIPVPEKEETDHTPMPSFQQG
jgi:nucleotide-binding universal stress UspA family protein